MEHEMPPDINVDLTTCVRNDDNKRTYSPQRLTLLAVIDVASGATANIAEGTGGGLLNTHS